MVLRKVPSVPHSRRTHFLSTWHTSTTSRLLVSLQGMAMVKVFAMALACRSGPFLTSKVAPSGTERRLLFRVTSTFLIKANKTSTGRKSGCSQISCCCCHMKLCKSFFTAPLYTEQRRKFDLPSLLCKTFLLSGLRKPLPLLFVAGRSLMQPSDLVASSSCGKILTDSHFLHCYASCYIENLVSNC